MRAVIQRVKRASVTVENTVVGEIGPGLLVLLGIEPADSDKDAQWLAQKIGKLKLFANESGDWDRSVVDAGLELLVVSQFTLFASTKKGTKPSWHRAAKPDFAEAMCARFVERLNEVIPVPAKTGRFGAMMDVALVNDGPVTLLIDSKLRE